MHLFQASRWPSHHMLKLGQNQMVPRNSLMAWRKRSRIYGLRLVVSNMAERTQQAGLLHSAPSSLSAQWRRSHIFRFQVRIPNVSSINAAQFLGAPLALINEDWHNDWIKFNKQQWGLLITTMTHWWSPTLVRISGDKSVRGQISKTADGRLECNFSQRMMLIANHQVRTLLYSSLFFTNGHQDLY